MSETMVLIIDDEPMVRRSLRRLLEREGAKVREACDGETGLEELTRDGCCNAVLVDLTMPGIPGPDVVRKLRAQYPSLAIFIVTGTTPDESLMAIADGVIAKPFSNDQVRGVLKHPRVLAA